MKTNKILRSLCYFTDNPTEVSVKKLNEIEKKLIEQNFFVQTKRICSANKNFKAIADAISDESILLSVGTLSSEELKTQFTHFCSPRNISCNVDLTSVAIEMNQAGLLFEIIKNKPEKTFNFTYVFNNPFSSPFFPSAQYKSNGISIGIQPTDLSEGCDSLDAWLQNMKELWSFIDMLFETDPEYLGIDSSVAPLFNGTSSFINFVKKLGISFSDSTTTDIYLKTTEFIKSVNPKPIGLCGIMFACLEDFELAQEYEQNNFSIERNVYLSLHSGLGIDTYPIGIDENPDRVIAILKLLQGFSNKYKKALSCRFVSDGEAKIGEKTDFQNQYLKDVIVKKL